MIEMVCVKLYRDGSYTVEDIGPGYNTQRLAGWDTNKGPCDIYHCYKSKWKEYLLKLTSTKDIDREIAKLQSYKRKREKLRSKLQKELGVKKKEQMNDQTY